MEARTARLAVFPDEPSARLAEGRLREAGIPCLVKALGVGPGGWGVALSLPHALYVREEDLERARLLLDLGEEPEPRRVPSLPWWVAALMALLAGAVVLALLGRP